MGAFDQTITQSLVHIQRDPRCFWRKLDDQMARVVLGKIVLIMVIVYDCVSIVELH